MVNDAWAVLASSLRCEPPSVHGPKAICVEGGGAQAGVPHDARIGSRPWRASRCGRADNAMAATRLHVMALPCQQGIARGASLEPGVKRQEGSSH